MTALFPYPDEKTALFIDGPNLHAANRALGWDMDYQRLLDWVRDESVLIRAYYYTAIAEGDNNPLVRLVDWMAYNGFCVRTKLARQFTSSDGTRRIKGNMDVEIAVDMLRIAQHIEHVILFSGDGDFRPLVAEVQDRGVRVSVVSSYRVQPSMVADDLRRQADAFVDLDDLRQHVGKEEK